MFSNKEKNYLEIEMKTKLEKLKRSLEVYTNQAANSDLNLELIIADIRGDIEVVEGILQKLKG